MDEARLNSTLWNAYADRYPDVTGSGLTPMEHYNDIGASLGRLAPHVAMPNDEVPCRSDDVEISVICLTYNHEKFIEVALKSVSHQTTARRTEIIIVDDCSTDETPRIVERFAASDIRVKSVRWPARKGVTASALGAISFIRGKYVAICEGDDYWTDLEKLEKQASYLDDHRDVAICYHPVQIFDEKVGVGFEYPPPDLREGVSVVDLLVDNFLPTSSLMYRWSAGDFVSQIDERLIPLDWYLNILHAKSGSIKCLPDTMSVYRRHDQNFWSSQGAPKIKDLSVDRGWMVFYRSLARLLGPEFRDYLENRCAEKLSNSIGELLLKRNVGPLLSMASCDRSLLFAAMTSFGLGTLQSHILTGEILNSILRTRLGVTLVLIHDDTDADVARCIRAARSQHNVVIRRIVFIHAADEDRDIPQQLGGIASDVERIEVECFSLARFAGYMRARAGIFAFCRTCDYWLSPFKLEKQIQAMFEHRTALSFTNCLMAPDMRVAPDGENEPIATRLSSIVFASGIPLMTEHSLGGGCEGTAHAIERVLASKAHYVPAVYSVHETCGSPTSAARAALSPVRIVRRNDESKRKAFLRLEAPNSGVTTSSEVGRLKLSGWMASFSEVPVKFLIRHKGRVEGFSPTIYRVDETMKFRRSHKIGWWIDPKCGFEIEIELDIGSGPVSLDFGLLTEDIEWHGSIEIAAAGSTIVDGASSPRSCDA